MRGYFKKFIYFHEIFDEECIGFYENIKRLKSYADNCYHYDDRVYVDITVSKLIKIMNKNKVQNIRFELSNVKKMNLIFEMHDTRCPKHNYGVQRVRCYKNYLDELHL